MYPILYETITPGTVPTNFGLGTLTDCLSCYVQEARNGVYELELVYPATGIHMNDLQPRRVIKAKPNFTDDPQLFRIYKVGKVMQGKVTVYAKHISYDLSGYVIESGSAHNCAGACSVLENAATGFTITTDKTVTAEWEVKYPSSVRSWLGGKEGSLLDVYGTGEYKYNNFDVSLLLHRGTNRGVTIRYGKNLTELTQELNSENLVTGVVAYYKDSEDNITKAPKVSTGLVLDSTKDYALDCSSDFDETPTVQDLTDKANAYIQNHILTSIVSNIKLNFAQMSQLKDRVDLCDTVSIYLEALGISATAQCIQTKWDVLEGKYIQTEFGEPKTNITDTIISIGNTADEAVTSNKMLEAINNATSKITGNQGGYVVFHDTNADKKPDEILVLDNLDIDQAVKVWRWNVGGLGYSGTGYDGNYVIALTNDGKIVADRITTGTLDCSTITVSNLNAGSINAGILQDAAGNNSWNLTTGAAAFTSLDITIGGVTKDVVTAIEDETASNTIRTKFAAGNNSITVSSGTIAFTADTFTVDATNLKITSAGVVKASNFSANSGIGFYSPDWSTVYSQIGLSLAGNPGIWLNSTSGNVRARMVVDQNNQGMITLYGSQNYAQFHAYVSQSGDSSLILYNQSGSTRMFFGVDSLDHSFLLLYNSSNEATASLYETGLLLSEGGDIGIWDGAVRGQGSTLTVRVIGSTGDIWATGFHQTSSREVKENIKDLTDEEALKVLQLRPVTFDYKKHAQGVDQRGFIAEEVNEIIPQITEEGEQYLGLNYTQIIPYLTKVIQLQEARITALEAKDK